MINAVTSTRLHERRGVEVGEQRMLYPRLTPSEYTQPVRP